ncbi:MAG: pilus assembly protein [Myxococcales bacterium]|nr:pilus assembly protein [Myxococcales bacterium]
MSDAPDNAVKRLKRDTRGAVLAEFVIALTPLLITFFSFVQMARIATTRLMVKHSAIVAARAASVITNGKDNTPDQNGGANQGMVTDAAKLALGPWNKQMVTVTTEINDQSSKADPYGAVTVTVRATYRCSVPMGSLFTCPGGVKVFTERAMMPHQGARYIKD